MLSPPPRQPPVQGWRSIRALFTVLAMLWLGGGSRWASAQATSNSSSSGPSVEQASSSGAQLFDLVAAYEAALDAGPPSDMTFLARAPEEAWAQGPVSAALRTPPQATVILRLPSGLFYTNGTIRVPALQLLVLQGSGPLLSDAEGPSGLSQQTPASAWLQQASQQPAVEVDPGGRGQGRA